jgi:hypothetical protein
MLWGQALLFWEGLKIESMELEEVPSLASWTPRDCIISIQHNLYRAFVALPSIY